MLHSLVKQFLRLGTLQACLGLDRKEFPEAGELLKCKELLGGQGQLSNSPDAYVEDRPFWPSLDIFPEQIASLICTVSQWAIFVFCLHNLPLSLQN